MVLLLATRTGERYVDLAMFLEDQSIPETTLRVLWKLDAILSPIRIGSWINGVVAMYPSDQLHSEIKEGYSFADCKSHPREIRPRASTRCSVEGSTSGACARSSASI